MIVVIIQDFDDHRAAALSGHNLAVYGCDGLTTKTYLFGTLSPHAIQIALSFKKLRTIRFDLLRPRP